MKGELKYMKRAGIYKGANVTFNPENFRAYSYDWWRFVDKINGKIVFNNYNYSNPTCKHQSKLRHLLDSLNIKIDMVIECPTGLQDTNQNCPSKSVSEHYSELIRKEKEAISKPRSQARKNIERKALIDKYAKLAVDFKILYEGK